MEVKYREEQVITSPYVTQADKMAVSLRHLADRFLKMEPKKQCFTPEEMTEMYDRITEKVCRGCSRKSECLERKKAEHWQLFYDLLCTIAAYGAEPAPHPQNIAVLLYREQTSSTQNCLFPIVSLCAHLQKKA